MQEPSTPVHHAIGNHCLSVDRQLLLKRLKLPGSFYAVHLPHGWRLIVLDTTEMSGHSNLPPVSSVPGPECKSLHPVRVSNTGGQTVLFVLPGLGSSGGGASLQKGPPAERQQSADVRLERRHLLSSAQV